MVVLGAAATAALAQEVKGNGDAAKDKVAMCIGCHGIPGYRASFPEVYEVPMLGGQSAKYIENALKGYQKGDRKHPTMRGIAATLTDQDIADVAAYYSQQKAGSQNNTLK
ncbi:cytochrome c [Cupriavidus yeoncheonensis]